MLQYSFTFWFSVASHTNNSPLELPQPTTGPSFSSISYKHITDPTTNEGTRHNVSKKEFCNLIKGAELVQLTKIDLDHPLEE